MKIKMRKPIAEKADRPASCCATPTVKGLIVAAPNPRPEERRLMPNPVMESQPSRLDNAIQKGTMMMSSSKMPNTDPKSIKKRLMSMSSL